MTCTEEGASAWATNNGPAQVFSNLVFQAISPLSRPKIRSFGCVGQNVYASSAQARHLLPFWQTISICLHEDLFFLLDSSYHIAHHYSAHAWFISLLLSRLSDR